MTAETKELEARDSKVYEAGYNDLQLSKKGEDDFSDYEMKQLPKDDEDGSVDLQNPDLDLPNDNISEGMGLPTPPDGGWGWVVVLASFFIHVIADGVAYSFGVFLEDFSTYFNTGHGSTSLLGSLMIGVTWGSGPIVSALTNVFGCRFTTILGGFVASFGFLISLCAPNIYFMYFSFGIVSGFGLGLIFVPAIVSVTFYFEKRRSFATGLAVCGSGIGTFVFGPLTEVMLNHYGSWKSAVLIDSALLLNCIVCGALFRPLKWQPKEKRPLAMQASGDNLEDQGELESTTNSLMRNGKLPQVNSSPAIAIPSIHVTTPEYLRANSSSSLPPHILREKEISKDLLRVQDSQTFSSDFTLNENGSLRHRSQADVGPLARKDIFYSSSLRNIPLYNENPIEYTRSITSIPERVEDMYSDEEGSSFLKKLKGLFTCKNMSWKEVLDFSVFKDVVFILFVISNFLTSLGFCIPYMFLPGRAKLMGCSRAQGAFLISIIGISNTIGRVVFGFISDHKGVNRLMLYNTVLTLCGICTMASSLCVNYALLCVYSGLFGLFLGVYVSITSVVLVDLLGLDKLTSSFGLTLMFQGIAAVLGPPIAGWIYDATSNYDLSFYIMGGLIAFSGIMLFPIPKIQQYLRNREQKRDIDLGKKPVLSSHKAQRSIVILEEDIVV